MLILNAGNQEQAFQNQLTALNMFVEHLYACRYATPKQPIMNRLFFKHRVFTRVRR